MRFIGGNRRKMFETLSERARLWVGRGRTEFGQLYCPRVKCDFLASVSLQTWIHGFSEDTCAVCHLPQANIISAFAQAAFTQIQEARLKQERKQHVYPWNSGVDTHLLSKHMSAWAYLESGLHIYMSWIIIVVHSEELFSSLVILIDTAGRGQGHSRPCLCAWVLQTSCT